MNTAKAKEKFDADIVVIGGGPAGLLAAGRAGELGAKVILIEKNQRPGLKLLMTGGGRCNITQGEFDDKKFVEKLGGNGSFLFSALAAFGPDETMKFFENLGLELKTERGRRVFPVSDKAQDVLDVLLKYINKNKVEMLLGREVVGFKIKDGLIESVKLKDREIAAKAFILCTGGKSFPQTGSSGSGYDWARQMGHKIIEPAPALVPVETKESWVHLVQGLTLKNVSVTLLQKDKEKDYRFGEMLFTHFGLSGPIILDLSKKIGELLAAGEAVLKIDLKPALDVLTLDKRLQRDFKSNRIFKNYLPELVPQKLGEVIVRFSKINPEKKVNSITKEERLKLIQALKSLKINARGLVGFSQAIVTSGGVDTKEISSKTLRSNKINNLFFAGEIIDLDGPTGGFNLQICWSTAYAAGTNAAGLVKSANI